MNEKKTIPSNDNYKYKKENIEFKKFLLEESFYRRTRKLSRQVNFALFSSIIILILLLIYLLLSYSDRKFEKYFSKEIKRKIVSSIENGADISVIKHIYASREIKLNKFHPFHLNKIDVYPAETSLDFILNDALVDYYITIPDNPKLVTDLKNIIKQYEEINPFDKLNETQKFL